MLAGESLAHLDNVEIVAVRRGSPSTWPPRSAPASSSRACGPSSDFEYELQMAQMNQAMSGIDTLFIPTASTTRSSPSILVREIAAFGGATRRRMVPEPVAKRLQGEVRQ